MRPTRAQRALLALVATAFAACGSSAGSTGSSHAPRSDAPITLHLRTSDGRTVATEDQLGSAFLLVVLATYDGVSQAAMRPLSRFARDHEDVLVLGILAQPDAETFVPLFEEAMSSPFAIAWDPNDTIARGVSDLGPLDAVPSYFAVDRAGRIAARHVGFMSERDLERMMEVAASR